MTTLKRAMYFLIACSELALYAPAPAIVIGSSSGASGLSMDFTVDWSQGPLSLIVEPTPTILGSAPPGYNLMETVVSFSAFTAGAGDFETGPMTAEAWSNVDGANGIRSATGEANVHDFVAVIFFGGYTSPFIILEADHIASRADVIGDIGALAWNGHTLLHNATLTHHFVGGGWGTLNLPSNPAPNTVMDNYYFSVILNEQVVSGDGIGNRAITTNAVRFVFHYGPPDGASMQGEITIAQSNASLTAIPEPGSLLALTAGLLLLVARRGRKG